MECEQIRDRVEAAAFQTLSEIDVQEIAAHIERGCPACAEVHLGALLLRKNTDRIRESHDAGGFRRRLRWRIQLVRAASLLVLAGVGWWVAAAAVHGAQVAGERRILRRLEKAVLRYRIERGSYPPSGAPLGSALAPDHAHPYLDGLEDRVSIRGEFLDRWGQPIRYRSPGVRNPGLADLWSSGPNRRDEGGRGDDIGNWSESPPATESR